MKPGEIISRFIYHGYRAIHLNDSFIRRGRDTFRGATNTTLAIHWGSAKSGRACSVQLVVRNCSTQRSLVKRTTSFRKQRKNERVEEVKRRRETHLTWTHRGSYDEVPMEEMVHIIKRSSVHTVRSAFIHRLYKTNVCVFLNRNPFATTFPDQINVIK